MNPLEAPRRISFDLDTFSGVARKRWWIVPLTMLIGLALMFWQESDLQTEPRYFSLTRMYEPSDEGAPLTLVGVNTDLISQFPNETNQATLLQSDEVKKKIQSAFDRDVQLLVKTFDKTFSLNTETDGPAITRFSFKPSRRFAYEFTCVETDELNCANALDMYAKELQAIRLEATKAGFANSIKLIDSLLAAKIDLAAADLSRLNLQKAAFTQAIELATGEIAQVSESKYFGGETIQTVDRRSYIFGLLVGLVIGILVLLQLVVSDNKIRSVKGLVAATNYESFLGEVKISEHLNSVELLAATVRGALGNQMKKLRLLPVGSDSVPTEITASLAKILDAEVTSTSGFANIKAADLVPDADSAIILAVSRDSASATDLQRVWTVLEKSGNRVLGSTLVSNK